MRAAVTNSIKSSPVRDTYRFGDGPDLVLKPGTMGWRGSEMEDPVLRGLWDDGRYEILDGVLTIMPAAFFRGGECATTLVFLMKDYFRGNNIPATFSSEVDIQINETRLLRADCVAVFGDDLNTFRGLKFSDPKDDWRDHALTVPPTLVIESVSQGHEAYDRQTKRNWYAEFGVKHYWIIDGFSKSLDCLLLQDDQYISEASGSNIEVLSPASLPGLKIPLIELWGG